METLKIKLIKKLSIKKKVYDLSVENNNNFFIYNGNEILTHNCDFLTLSAQAALRNIIESYSLKTRFIFTCNYLDRIIEPLQSRCSVFKMEPPSKSDIGSYVVSILEKENIKYEEETIANIILKLYPDIRRIINSVQEGSSGGTLKMMENTNSTQYKEEIYNLLSNSNKDSWRSIRQILVDNDISDYKELYTYLYDKYFDSPNIVVILAEVQYRDAFVADHEINFMAAVAKILESKKQILHG